MYSYFKGILSVAIISFAGSAAADTDEPPLFVAASGHDAGNCQSAISPCRTIQYALRIVGKNGRIRIGDGSFELAEIADLVYLLSGAIDVRGSHADGSISTLVGVPHEFATKLEAKGFRVIADAKGLHQAAVNTQLSLNSNAPASVCVDGFAGSFPCNNVDLLAHIADRTPAARGADIWGFMDLNTHREYAIIGYSTGTAVFDVTDAESPREVGFIDGQTTTWRDIKVRQTWDSEKQRWEAFAYVTADNATDGLVIIDLSELPQRISRMANTSSFFEAHNVYITDTEFSTGLSISGDLPMLIIAGSDQGDGRFLAYTFSGANPDQFLATPVTPANQGGQDRLYMHDAASMIITDNRKDSQCVNTAGADHCDLLFDFNEATLDIWDVSNPLNPERLSHTSYLNASYTHSGWWSEDKMFVFLQDELDERDRGLQTTLRIFSVADLTAPVLVGSWTGPSNAIDHNGFVRGNRYYMSNYSRGLTVLDISNSAEPVSVGRFDTYPASDNVGFPGNWGVYPFLPSGNIALSDIDSGFYLVADNTLSVPQGSLSFSVDAFAADETQAMSLVVQRSGGAQAAATVAWEVIPATGMFDDVATRNGVLSWPDGDSSDRIINIGVTNDGIAEGLERVLVKLSAPTGGATLSSPSMASAYISDPGDTPTVAFSTAAISVAERGFGVAIAVVHRTGSALGAVSVDYSITGGDATGSADYTGSEAGSLSWADGDANPKWIEYAIADDGDIEVDEFFELSLINADGASIGANSTLQIEILDGAGSNGTPNSVAGFNQTVASGSTVTLDGSESNDPDGDPLTYAWSQTTGLSVVLSNADAALASFAAPSLGSDSMLRFELEVSDPAGLEDISTVTVTVSADTSNTSGGGSGTMDYWLLFTLFGILTFIRKDAT